MSLMIGDCVSNPIQDPYTELMILEVHVGTPIPKCREINAQLLADSSNPSGYEPELFENLVFRYEEPNGMTRWDSPLFTVPYEDETPPMTEIWEAMVGSDGAAKVVRPNQATVLVSRCGIYMWSHIAHSSLPGIECTDVHIRKVARYRPQCTLQPRADDYVDCIADIHIHVRPPW